MIIRILTMKKLLMREREVHQQEQISTIGQTKEDGRLSDRCEVGFRMIINMV